MSKKIMNLFIKNNKPKTITGFFNNKYMEYKSEGMNNYQLWNTLKTLDHI